MVVIFLTVMVGIRSQSTCPVIQPTSAANSNSNDQKCKCGIKIDGHIYIYCARKQLKQLPKFTRSSILYDELILSGNQFEKIQVNSFNGLKVKRLLLDDNPIETIEPQSFVELANYLEELIISVLAENRKTRLESSLFQSLLNLKVVKLSGMAIDDQTVLKQNLFNRTRKLEIINLVDCNLASIERFALNGVETSLRELNLDNNQLDSPNELFNEIKRMKRLQLLNLSRNRIKHMLEFVAESVPSEMLFSVEPFEIDLSFNGILTIDERAFGSRAQNDGIAAQISKLNLNNNELNQFQLNFVSQLDQLRELHLDYNKIEYIVDNLFLNSRQLEVLSLKGNLIQKLSSEFVFSGLHFNLKKLNLAANRLDFINKRAFTKVNRLRELSLERNSLSVHFDSVWASNKTFTESSSMASMGGIFDGIESELKYLNLEYNGLGAKHLWSLAGLINLETIKLGNNDFSELNVKSKRVLGI